jgi:hypothetical protein
LQFMVLVGLCLRYFVWASLKNDISIPFLRLSHPIYRNYGIYFGLAIVAGIMGGLLGAYDLPDGYAKIDQSGLARFVNSQSVRPLFEYFITFFYFFYFVFLSQRLLCNQKSINYFFSVFKFMFMLSLILGIIDVGLYLVNIEFIPRHISDWRHVGFRFHGLAGEPRDAFVYLFLALAVLHLRCFFKDQLLSKYWIVVIVAAAMMTQSASGILGIGFFCLLLGMDSLRKLNLHRILGFLMVLVFALPLLYVGVSYSDRIMLYLEILLGLWGTLESGGEVPGLIIPQMQNIYPMYTFAHHILNLDFLSVLFGSGLGSASVINNYYLGSGEMMNPHSQIVRTLYESGCIGFWFFMLAFFDPINRFIKNIPPNKRQAFIVVTLLLIGCFLSHRSSAPYIYLGIFLAVFRFKFVRPIETQ